MKALQSSIKYSILPTMKTLTDIRKELKETLPQGIDLAISALKSYLPEGGSDKCNDLILLDSRYRETQQKLLQGIISNEDADLEFNRLRKALLDFIENLQEADLRTAAAAANGAKPDMYNGEVLYRIPRKMQVQKEVKCIVRVAFDKEKLVEDLEMQAGDVIKDIRISDVMGVELLDPNPDKEFEIRTLTDTVQFLDKNIYAEWIFYVKPLSAGTYPLVLKISVIEIRDGIERKRNVVMEEQVEIITDAPAVEKAAEQHFMAAGYTLNFAPKTPGVPTMPSSAPSQPSPAPYPPAPAPSKKSSSIAGALLKFAAIAAVLVIGWVVVNNFSQKPEDKDWQTAARQNNKAGYEEYLQKHSDEPEAQIARAKLDSIEAATWESALASNDTLQIKHYIAEYPEGKYVALALQMLEQGRVPQAQEVYMETSVTDSTVKIVHGGGKPPYRFSFLKNGEEVKVERRDTTGEFHVPISDFQAGEYELMLHDTNGFSQVGSFKIVAPAPPTTTKKEAPAPTSGGKKKTGKTDKKAQPSTPEKIKDEPTNTPTATKEATTSEVLTPKEPVTTKEQLEKEVGVAGSQARLPIYKGCKKSNRKREENCTEVSIQNFVVNRFEYPADARRKGVAGTVIIAFYVEKDGTIGDVNILKDIGAGCGAHAADIIKKLPRFEAPGKNRKGEPVRMLYKLPVTFKLG